MNLENTNKYLNGKFFTILGLLAVFAIALLFVYGITIEREGRLKSVTQEIEQKYAAQQIITGPILKTTNGTNIYPTTLNIEVKTNSDSKSRGIFEVPIYSAEVEITGSFPITDPDQIESLDIKATDTQKISNITNTNNRSTFRLVNNTTDTISQPTLNNTQRNFNISFDIIGTKSLKFITNGEKNTLSINSDWKTPSFQGLYLPSSSEITQDGFTANWEHTQASDFQNKYIDPSNAIGYDMFQVNNIYSKTVKSIKYGIVVIALVFFSFFIVEIFSGQRVNNLQYILIGLSLVVYYSLLLSLGEIIGFTLAYLLASMATILLNTFFATLLLKKSKYGLSIASILTVIYLSIFALLQTTQYTLLLGSILAYLIIMVSMIASYYINFDKLKNSLNQSNV